MKKYFAGGLTALLVAGGLVVAAPAIASATTEAPVQCDAVQEVRERLYEKVIPGSAEEGHEEWRWLIERKEVQSVKWTGNTPLWIGDGEWYGVPQNLVDAANFDPRQYTPNEVHNNLPGNLYNLGSVGHAPYTWRYHYEISDHGTLETSPFGAGIKVEIKYVKTKDAVPESTVQSDWTTDILSEPWVQIDERVKTPGSPANWQTTNPGAPCYNGPKFLELSHVQYCGGVDITLRNVSPWIYPTSVLINDTHSYGPTVDNRTDGKLNGPIKDQSRTRTITFPEDSGTHTVEYRIDAGSERDLYVGTSLNEWTVLTIDSDCEVNIPEQPEPRVVVETVTVEDCETATITEITTTTTYPVFYNAETNTWDEGEPVIEVVEDERLATVEECPVEVTPSPTPTPVVAAVSDELPPTGVDVMPALWFGGSVGALGFAFLVWAGLRQRRLTNE